MEVPRRQELTFDLGVFTKNELAWVLQTRLDSRVIFNVEETLITEAHKAQLMTLTKRHLPDVVNAYLAAGQVTKFKMPYNSEPLADYCIDECTVLIGDAGITVTTDDKTKVIPVVSGAIDWNKDLNRRSLALAKEVMHDVCIVNNKPIVIDTPTTGFFAPVNNKPQAAASKVVADLIVSQGLIKSGSWAGYDLGNAVYSAAQKTHVGGVMDLYSEIVIADPPALKAKSQYDIVSGYRQKMWDPKNQIASNYDFSKPPKVRVTTSGKSLKSNYKPAQIQSMVQNFGAALGGDKFRKSSLSTYVMRAPLTKAQYNEISLLKDVQSLNIPKGYLLVLNISNPNQAQFVAHNMGMPVACYGPSMTLEERRLAYDKKEVITYQTMSKLTEITIDGKALKLVVYHPSVKHISPAKSFSKSTTGAVEVMEKHISDNIDGNIHVYNVTITALGEKCDTPVTSVDYSYNKTKIPHYASLAFSMGQMNCLVSSNQEIFRTHYTLQEVTYTVCLFMFNLMYFRYHAAQWHEVYAEAINASKQVFLQGSAIPWHSIEYSPVPKDKVIWGYDLAFMTVTTEKLINQMDMDVVRDGLAHSDEDDDFVQKKKKTSKNKKEEESGEGDELEGSVEEEDESEDDNEKDKLFSDDFTGAG